MDIWKQPPGGFTPRQLRQRRRSRSLRQLALSCVVLLAVAGVGGYRWITTVQPIDRSHAVDLFRAGRTEVAAAAADRARAQPVRDKAPGRDRSRPTRLQATTESSAATSSRSPAEVAVSPSRPKSSTTSPRDRGQPEPKRESARPEEGVYSWATEGHEQVGGARREFPEETQRIITLGENEIWTQHHYFSEERQIWTAFQRSSVGVHITEQRNKVTFGPVTSESEIDFDPPMLAGPHSLRVGFQWNGTWSGDTYGDYSGDVFERSVIEIGGERVEVWGMTYVINLHGEQEGRVEAEVWFAPGPLLTVKEHYVQDVESRGARYHAEWTQTLKSLKPRQ